MKFPILALFLIICISCTDNRFTIEDERIDIIPESNGKKNIISFQPSVHGYASTGISSTPFPEGNMAQIFAWDVGVQLSQYRYYRAMSPGTLSPVELPLELVNGLYDFYAVSVNSPEKPPVFLYSVASDISNGVDYLWYRVRDQIIVNPTTIPIQFKHCGSQIIINSVNAGDEKVVDWVSAATMAAPVLNKQTTWNLYNGVIGAATEFSMMAPLNMTAYGLTCQQLIIPVSGVSSFYVYLQMKLWNEDEIRGYPLTLPIPDNELQAGKSYHYEILFSKDTVTVSTVNIASWIEVDEYGNPLYPDNIQPL